MLAKTIDQSTFLYKTNLSIYVIPTCRAVFISNHYNSRKQSKEPIKSKQIHVAGAMRGKVRTGNSRLVFVLLLIGRELKVGRETF